MVETKTKILSTRSTRIGSTLVPVGRRARRLPARCGRDVCQPAQSWHQPAHMLDGCRHDEDAMCANRRNLGTNWRTCSTVAGTMKTRCAPGDTDCAPTGIDWCAIWRRGCASLASSDHVWHQSARNRFRDRERRSKTHSTISGRAKRCSSPFIC
jgi:hypothetical protein